MSDIIGASSSNRRERPKTVEGLFFDHWRDTFNRLGWKDAADNLDRYLGGAGAEKVYSEKQIEEMDPVTYRIGRNNTRFESNTFIGRTDNKEVKQALETLQSGQPPVKFEDYWDAPYSPKRILPNAAEGIYAWVRGKDASKLRSAYDDLADTVAHPATYAAIGSFPLRSKGDFSAERKGDKLFIKGTVRHRLDDTFNFDPGQPGDAPGQVLEDTGLAAEFPFRYRSEQDVEAEGEYGPGGITLKRVTWGKRR